MDTLFIWCCSVSQLTADIVYSENVPLVVVTTVIYLKPVVFYIIKV